MRRVPEAGVVEEASSRSVRALHILLNPGVAYIPEGGTLGRSCLDKSLGHVTGSSLMSHQVM